MADFILKNDRRLIELFSLECDAELQSTQDVVDKVSQNSETLDLSISKIIKFLLFRVLYEIGVDISNKDEILEQSNEKSVIISRETGLKVPLKVPKANTLIVLVGSFCLLLSMTLFLLLRYTDYAFPIIIVTGLTFLLPTSILMWGLFLKVFKNSFGKQSFVGVDSFDLLIKSLVEINRSKFNEDDYLNEVLKEIADGESYEEPIHDEIIGMIAHPTS